MKINNSADLSETFGTLKRKMSGQEFKDLIRNIKQEDDKETKKGFPESLKSS